MAFARATKRSKSVESLRRRVNNYAGLLEFYENECRKLKGQRDLMAKLAADEPQFNNPLVVWGAKELRDSILNGEA